jgi:hypothetical protein
MAPSDVDLPLLVRPQQPGPPDAVAARYLMSCISKTMVRGVGRPFDR